MQNVLSRVFQIDLILYIIISNYGFFNLNTDRILIIKLIPIHFGVILYYINQNNITYKTKEDWIYR